MDSRKTDHAYAVTIAESNPHAYSPEFASCSAGDGILEDPQQVSENYFAAFVGGHEDCEGSPETSGAVGACEVSDGNISHAHIAFLSKRLIAFESLRRKFSRASIDIVRCDRELARDYILGKGTFKEGTHRHKCEPLIRENYIVR